MISKLNGSKVIESVAHFLYLYKHIQGYQQVKNKN